MPHPAVIAAWNFVRDSSELLESKPPPGDLFHYTDVASTISILKSRRLWVSDVRCMNDTQELQHGLELIKRTAKSRSSGKQSDTFLDILAQPEFNGAHVFALSFSTEGDLLSQWRAYADDGCGCSIRFRFGHELPVLLPEGWEWTNVVNGAMVRHARLFKIEYDYEMQERLAAELVQKALNAVVIDAPQHVLQTCARAFAAVFYTFGAACKNEGFKEEAEWRLVWTFVDATTAVPSTPPKTQFRNGRYGLTPYIETPIGEFVNGVVFGPKQSKDRGESLMRSLLYNCQFKDWDVITINCAKASYR